MCHNDSPAPQLGADVTYGRVSTPGADPVPYEVFQTREPGPAPWVVLVTDIFGINPFYRHLGERLVRAGYRVAVPDLFHRVGPARDDGREAALERRGELDDQQAVDDLAAVIDAAVAPTPEGPRFGTLGFCLGGTLALLSAAARPAQATVTYYAFPRAAPGAAAPAAHPIDVAARVEGPVLAFWGREDYIDAGEVAELGRALASGPAAAEIRWFDGAGHAFLAGLTEERSDSDAARSSWVQALDFLGAHVQTERGGGST